MNIHLPTEDFVWKVEPTGDFIGELFLNSHPRFQRTFTPKDLILTIENEKTSTYGIYSWFSSQQTGGSFQIDHMYKCHSIVRNGIITIPALSYEILAILRHK